MAGAKQTLRGVTSDRELRPDQLYRDLRTPMEIVGDFLADNPAFVQMVCFVLMVPILFSRTFFILFSTPVIIWLSFYPKSKRQTLPLLLPREAGIEDEHDPKPGRHGNFKARGQIFLGNMRSGKRPYEAWLSFSHMLQHVLLVGSTGAGKTETLVSMAANYISTGSGVTYADAKAAPKLGWQIFTLARYFGREDDFRALNYIKGNTSKKPDRAERRSNNVNLFAFGNAESIIQLIVSIMPPGGAENKLFSERAIGLISAVMPALVDLRDSHGLLITPAVIRKALELPQVERLRKDPRISPESREAIRAYLASLPGYQEDAKDSRGNPKKQPEEVGRQFGFAQAYFTRSLSSLSDTYSDIYMVGRGEISFLDIVLRRRICVVMIPALEKAPEEQKNLAKIVLAAQKNAVSTGLPPDIEGRKEDRLDALPTTAQTPYVLINDEFAFMMTPGYGTLLAQARGLSVGVVIAGQDYAGMKREDADEAEQIAENTKTKIVMASEGLGATAELIKQVAGEATVASVANFAADERAMTQTYRDNRNVNLEKRSRIDTMDTRSQVEGEGIIFWRDKIVPISMFYHGLSEDTVVDYFHIPRMLDVGLPNRGPGLRLVRNESEYLRGLKNCVKEGSYVVDDTLIPPSNGIAELVAITKTMQTIRFKSSEKRNIFLFGALFSGVDEDDLFEALKEESRQSTNRAKPLDEVPNTPPPAKETRRAKKTTQPENSSPPSNQAKNTSTHKEAAETLNKLTTADASYDNTEFVSEGTVDGEIDSDTPSDQHWNTESNHTSEENQIRISSELNQLSDDEPAKALLESAPWMLDAMLLADKECTEQELEMGKEVANSTAQVELAMGREQDEAYEIGKKTSQTVLRSINYPNPEGVPPNLPKDAESRNAVIKTMASNINAWLDNSNE